MKLLSTTYGGVQSLGRENIAKVGAKFNAEQRASASLTRAITGAADTIIGISEAANQEDARKRALEIKGNLANIKSKAQTTLTWDMMDQETIEFLDGVKYQDKDADGNVRETINGSEVMAQAWENNRNKALQKGMEGMNWKQKEYISKYLDEYVIGSNTEVGANSVRAENKRIRTDAIATSEELVDKGLLQDAIENIGDAVPFTDSERLELAKKLTVKYETNQVYDAMLVDDQGQSATALADSLEDDAYQGELSDKQRVAAVNSLRKSAYDKQEEIREKANYASAMYKASLDVGIAKGEVTEWDLAQALQQGKIKPNEWAEFEKRRLTASKKQRETQVDVGFMNDVMNDVPGASFNPNNPKHTKAFDKFAEKTDDMVFLELASTKVGYMPQKMVDHIEGGIQTGDPKRQAQGLETFARIQKTKPAMLEQLSKSTVDQYAYADTLVNAGMEPGEAMRKSTEYMRLAPEYKDQRGAQWTEFSKEYDFADELESMMGDDDRWDDGWFGSVDPDSQMGMDFKAAYERIFMLSGDPESAKKAAYNILGNKWDQTTVGKNLLNTGDARPMAYAPEAVTGMDAAEINYALQEFANDNGFPADSISLYSDRRNAQGTKSWGIMYEGMYGEIVRPIDPVTGQFVRFEPLLYYRQVQATKEALEMAEAIKSRDAANPGETRYRQNKAVYEAWKENQQ